MLIREPDDLPYRTPVTASTPVEPFTKDEEQYDTLLRVRQLLAESLENLTKDFNLFDVLSPGTDKEKIDHMMRKIGGNQIAYDILAPLLDAIDSATHRADDNFKKRNQQ